MSDSSQSISSEFDELGVDDEDDYSPKRAIRRYHDLRDDMKDARRLLAEMELQGRGENEMLRFYRRMTDYYIEELRTQLTNPENPQSDFYWNEIELAQLPVEPPKPMDPQSLRPDRTSGNQDGGALLAPGESRPKSKTLNINGLRWFSQNPVAISVKFEARLIMSEHEFNKAIKRQNMVRGRYGSRERDPCVVIRDVLVPIDILNDAIAASNEFLRDIGLDIELTPGSYQSEEPLV